MSRNRILSRFLRATYVLSLVIWIGGFTFYSGVVIPILHDEFGDAFLVGTITRRVTDCLNVIGGAAVVSGWCWILADWRTEPTVPFLLARRPRMAAATVFLVALFVLHWRMDRMLDLGTLGEFYSWHRAYLWASVGQWLANLSLLIEECSRGRGAGVSRTDCARPPAG